MKQLNSERIVASASIVACSTCVLLPLAGCAPLLGAAGYTNPLVQALATQIDKIKLAVDAGSYVSSGKTVSDHVVSQAVGKDCRLFNVASGAPVCSSVAADDRPLTNVDRAVERTDCKTGTEHWHARIAFEALGGQVTSFAYYSIWKPRTCSLDFERDAPGTNWSRTPEGETRVDTAQGTVVIRTRPDSYVFEFRQVQRQKFCGMPGEINGSMIVTRGTGTPECLAVGIMDTNDALLDRLYKVKQPSPDKIM